MMLHFAQVILTKDDIDQESYLIYLVTETVIIDQALIMMITSYWNGAVDVALCVLTRMILIDTGTDI